MNNAKATYPKRRHIRIGIKWKMFAILICVISIFVIASWVILARTLNLFYQNAKFRELKKSAESISYALENDDLIAGVCSECADEYNNDIWLYRLYDGKLDFEHPFIYEEGTKDSVGPFLESNFGLLYERTLENEGVYIAIVPMSNFGERYFEFKIIADNMDRPEQYPSVSSNINGLNAMYCSIYQSRGESYLIIQRSNISPIVTVVRTFENQALFLGTLMIIFALFLAVIMSRLITRPIVNINESARRLADGRYDIEFSGHGYREIEELTETLNFAVKELSKNDTLQKELISNISHDLRTPLTMIKGYSEVMRDIPGENTPENVQVIIDETTRLTELVNDMLDISKIQAGSRIPEMREFSLTEAVRATMFRCEKLTMQDGYKIDFFADGDASVIADRGMILQVVYNLINNAINYTGSDKYVAVRQTVSGDTVRISVSDTGVGIDESDIPFIWDRYYKVDKVHRRATVGTGLGLSIVKGILELHNATYGVMTTKNKGSTFWFELKTADSDEYKAELVEM